MLVQKLAPQVVGVGGRRVQKPRHRCQRTCPAIRPPRPLEIKPVPGENWRAFSPTPLLLRIQRGSSEPSYFTSWKWRPGRCSHFSELKPSDIGKREDLSPGLSTRTLPPGLASNQRRNQDSGVGVKVRDHRQNRVKQRK